MTTHETLVQIRYFAHKYAKWGDIPVKIDTGNTYKSVLVNGYQSSPTPHVLLSLDSKNAQALTVSAVTQALALYETKSYPVFVQLDKDDVREITSVAVDTPQKLILLQVA